MIEVEAERLLRGASLRVTRPRIAVLAAIHEHRHLEVAEIIELVRHKIGSVSTQTVYGVLNVLVEVGLARRIDLPGSAALYEGQTDDGHQHAVCRSCGEIVDVEAPAPDLSRIPSVTQNFTIDAVEVTYWGLCLSCQRAGLTADTQTVQPEFPHNPSTGEESWKTTPSR